MPILSGIYSAGDSLKRRIGGLLDDPKGTLEQFVGQLRDDMTRNSDLMNQAGWGKIDKVQYTPEQQAAARKQLADIGTNMAMAAATVWHGSPHKFSKFDSSKIGTGEGAQAYGHGLYLAESPEVSKTYMRTQMGNAPELEQMAIRAGVSPDAANTVAQWYHSTKNANGLDDFLQLMNTPHPAESIRNFRKGVAAQEPAIRDAWKQFTDPGYLYKVDLPDEHIAKMLDWDKPLSQQPQSVRDALAATKNKQLRAIVDYASSPYATPGLEDEVKTMGEAIKLLGMNTSPAKGSAMLAKQGIPGIRYLDGGSRGTGSGTSNFVIFPGNEDMLTILERNGKPLGLLGD